LFFNEFWQTRPLGMFGNAPQILFPYFHFSQKQSISKHFNFFSLFISYQ